MREKIESILEIDSEEICKLLQENIETVYHEKTNLEEALTALKHPNYKFMESVIRKDGTALYWACRGFAGYDWFNVRSGICNFDKDYRNKIARELHMTKIVPYSIPICSISNTLEDSLRDSINEKITTLPQREINYLEFIIRSQYLNYSRRYDGTEKMKEGFINSFIKHGKFTNEEGKKFVDSLITNVSDKPNEEGKKFVKSMERVFFSVLFPLLYEVTVAGKKFLTTKNIFHIDCFDMDEKKFYKEIYIKNEKIAKRVYLFYVFKNLPCRVEKF